MVNVFLYLFDDLLGGFSSAKFSFGWISKLKTNLFLYLIFFFCYMNGFPKALTISFKFITCLQFCSCEFFRSYNFIVFLKLINRTSFATVWSEHYIEREDRQRPSTELSILWKTLYNAVGLCEWFFVFCGQNASF